MYTNWYKNIRYRCQNITEHDRIRYWWKYIGCRRNYSTWKIRSKIYFLKRRKSIARTKERSVICQHSCLIMMRTSTMLGILKAHIQGDFVCYIWLERIACHDVWFGLMRKPLSRFCQSSLKCQMSDIYFV